ncbi:MAG: hypothetical protein ABI586_03795, partial [Candidatus Nanopelagicales bacterium]
MPLDRDGSIDADRIALLNVAGRDAVLVLWWCPARCSVGLVPAPTPAVGCVADRADVSLDQIVGAGWSL